MNFRRRSSGQELGFQIAPMIDVVFLLLCFFIASQVFSQWETEIDIKLPTAKTGAVPNRLPGEIIINIRESGLVVVNQERLSSSELQALLGRIVSLFPHQPVVIRADKGTDYEHIVMVLDSCRQSDIWNISFATAHAEKEEKVSGGDE